MRHEAGVLQLASAVHQTLRHPSLARQDGLLGIEKGLLQDVSDDVTSPFQQMIKLLEQYVETAEQER